MRTTVTLDDEIVARAKRRARERGITVSALIEAALRRDLAREERPAPPQIPVRRGGSGPRPGVDLTSNRALAEVLDEGQPLDRLR